MNSPSDCNHRITKDLQSSYTKDLAAQYRTLFEDDEAPGCSEECWNRMANS